MVSIINLWYTILKMTFITRNKIKQIKRLSTFFFLALCMGKLLPRVFNLSSLIMMHRTDSKFLQKS